MTRIPIAPLYAVVCTNLLFVIFGVALTASALLALRLGNGVRDAQVRLTSAAIVAERFEDPALANNARSVGELYAERRGMPSTRVGMMRREEGGRGLSTII